MRNSWGRRLSSGPAAMTSDKAASTQRRGRTLCGRPLASDVSKWAYHDGCPLAAAVRVDPSDPPARLAGKSHSTDDSAQNPDQANRGAPAPNGPLAAADDAMPGATPAASPAESVSVGHTSSAMSGYKMTAPGAPVSGDAAPVSSRPNPSPNHQTPKAQIAMATMAGFTVRRNSIPTPMASWMAPKKKFHTPASGRTKCARLVIDHANGAGWP